MSIAEALAVAFGISVAVNLLLTAFGSLQPSRVRRAFDRSVTIGLRLFAIYMAAALLFVTFQGLSVERTVRSTLANMFAVTLAVLVVAVLLHDLFGSAKPPRHD